MLATILLLVGSPAQAQVVDPNEAAQRILLRSITPQRDGSHLSLLFALRQLRDPDLVPFFQHLLKTGQWQLQVHAALALGELDTNKKMDATIIATLPALAQDAVVATALDLELLSTKQIPDVLVSEDLHPMARLVLLAELVAPPAKSEATTLTLVKEQLLALNQHEDEHIKALSSCLLVQLGEKDRLAAVQSQLDSLNARRAGDLRLWLFDAIRRYQMTVCLGWVKDAIAMPDQAADITYRGVFTLLELDPEAGLAAWKVALGTNASYSHRVRYCTLLLVAGDKVPASTYDLLTSNPPNPDEELIAKMIATGKAIASKGDASGPLIALFELDHLKTSEWAMEHTAKLPPDQSAPVYEYLIDRMSDPNRTSNSVEFAVAATSKLFAIDSAKMLQRLQSATDDGLLQQAILLGLFEANSSQVGQAAASLRRIGSGRADSLALLLIAKHSKALEKSDVDQLGKIAAGGGGLSEVLQVQAAWMYLKFTGQTDKTLTQLFASN